jgi:hypothetical protein
MPRFQLVIDCADPDKLARFWAEALGYVFEPPPEGFATWDDYWRDFGLGEDDLGIGEDSIVDPDGHGPRIWCQIVPEGKTIKNRLHLDISVGGDARCPKLACHLWKPPIWCTPMPVVMTRG